MRHRALPPGRPVSRLRSVAGDSDLSGAVDARTITADDVRLIRDLLLADLRGRPPSTDRCGPSPSIARMFNELSFAELRTGLALLASRCRAADDISVVDAWLWIDSGGLRGVRMTVRTLAEQFGLSTRQAHRRIGRCNAVIARALNRVPPRIFRSLVQAGRQDDRSELELLETARAESHLLPETARALDALHMYHRNRLAARTTRTRPSYLAGNKDVRYRDASRVAVWLKSVAADPPLPSTNPPDEQTLLVCQGIELAADPHEALIQVNQAIWTQQRQVLPILLAHAGRLISDIGTAGVDAWLCYLHIRFHAAMESEHIVALRYARALQVDAARYSPLGIRDARVRRGISGRGHILQMFGHYDAAIQCYTQAIRHAAHFWTAENDSGQAELVYRENVLDAHAQLVYTEALRRGDHVRALAALRRVHAIADQDERIEIQFNRDRRALELALGFAVHRHNLVIDPGSRRQAALIEDQFSRFIMLATTHPSPNRQLAAQDITLLYAVLTRDAGLAEHARNEFQHVNDSIGGFANLTDRFNNRLNTAKTLSKKFVHLSEATGPTDPLRNRLAAPAHSTGLLVQPIANYDHT